MRCWPTSLKVLVGLGWAWAFSLQGAESSMPPVTPNATPAAVELLKFIYTISGQHTLSGQHNFPADKDKHTQAALNAWGKLPALFDKDWGFAKHGQRQLSVSPEAIRQLFQEHDLKKTPEAPT